MISKEKLQEVTSDYLALAIAKEVAVQLQEKWDVVLSELVSTRKSNEHLTEKLGQVEAKFEMQAAAIVEQYQNMNLNIETTRENNRKAALTLKAAAKDLGLSE